MASQATLNKQANALITLFVQQYTEHYNKAPSDFNRYKSKWGFLAMLEDLGYELSQEVIKYYFKTGRQGHGADFLFHNYEKIAGFYKERTEDEERRRILREETRKRVEGLNG